MRRPASSIAAATMLAVTAGPVGGCGYLLHPERRGQQSGVIDGATMVMDLLWLLPGIVPGVVALIVDFSSGAIYIRGSRYAVHTGPDGHVAFRVPASARPADIEVRLVDAAGHIVARHSAHPGDQVDLDVGPAARRSSPLYLEVATAGATARLATPVGS